MKISIANNAVYFISEDIRTDYPQAFLVQVTLSEFSKYGSRVRAALMEKMPFTITNDVFHAEFLVSAREEVEKLTDFFRRLKIVSKVVFNFEIVNVVPFENYFDLRLTLRRLRQEGRKEASPLQMHPLLTKIVSANIFRVLSEVICMLFNGKPLNIPLEEKKPFTIL